MKAGAARKSSAAIKVERGGTYHDMVITLLLRSGPKNKTLNTMREQTKVTKTKSDSKEQSLECSEFLSNADILSLTLTNVSKH